LTLKRNIIFAFLLITTFVATAQSYNNIEFIENRGQWDSRVKFEGEVNTGAFFIHADGFTVLQHNQQDLEALRETIHGHKESGSMVSRNKPLTLRSHAYKVNFLGASSGMEIIPDKPLQTYNNYFIGNDPSKWAGGCRIFQGITVKNVYPNIDVRYYTDKGVLTYDIIAKPGADISKIALKYDGVDKLQVKNKELLIGTSVGELKESSPYTYESNGKERKEVSCKYVIKNNVVSFDVRDHDPNSTLIIDPNLIFCSFSGGTATNWGFTATYGPDGSTYGGGIVFANGFPVLGGAFQTTFNGGDGAGFQPIDIGIVKLSPNGSSRVYATYLGGKGNELPSSLIVDNQGELIVTGRSTSSDYPTFPNNNIGINNPGGSWDIIVTKFNAAGTTLIGSKKVGGTGMDGANITEGSTGISSLYRNYGDEARSEVIIDGTGNIYVASCTQSSDPDPAKKFPTTAGAFQPNFGGGTQDGVVLKFDPNVSSLLFSSFLGGSANDAAYVLSIGSGGDIYVAGGTESLNFPGNHAGTIGTANHIANGSAIDGFVAEISNNGSSIIRSTYIGTSGIDQVYGIQFDKKGFPYVTGQTTGAWPHINAAFYNNNGRQFIAKLQPDLSAYVYSTVFGTGAAVPNISPTAFLVDRCENVYVAGWGGDVFRDGAFPSAGTTGLPTTLDAIKKTSSDNADFYFFVLKKDAVNQLYGSFYGQDGGFCDHVDGGTSRFDQNGVIYEAMCANCGGGVPFPTTPGAYATTKAASANCSLAMVKIAFNLAGVGSGVQSAINGVPRDSSGCVPLTVDFSDTVRNAVSYEWTFGDGSPMVPTTNSTISHAYNVVGNYLVMLVAIDPNTCNVRDTSYVHIRVGDIKAILDFTPVKLQPCDSFKYRFDNLSFAPPVRPFGPQSFVWDFGDGSPRITTGTAPGFHNYAGPGTYNVRLILTDTGYCNAPDSLTIQLRVAANVKAQFTTPPVGCAPYNAVFTNTSLAGQTFQWDFGDGTTSTATDPTHLYNIAGSYTITLIANDPNTCNLTDTTRLTITVFDNPVADFSTTPDPPLENTPTSFTNLSSADAIRFKWDFGNGDTLNTITRLPIQHQYNATGTFNACLTAYNAAGCSDTTCKQVSAIVFPLVDVPNAFTPQSGDINSVIMVRGFGIAKMQFIIWNRWGQKVFETTNRLQGWDGKVKGAMQPMDVYAYTLSVEFFDGTKTTKKGDITLIR
jgi:gliding motility-associated-like protein